VGIEEAADGGEAFDAKMERLTTELSGLFAEGRKLEKEIKKRLARLAGRCRVI